MRTAVPNQAGDPGSIAALEAVLKSRLGWADGVISPFALASRHHQKFRGHRRRRLSMRAQGSGLRGIAAARR
jgi:hypothetical protein